MGKDERTPTLPMLFDYMFAASMTYPYCAVAAPVEAVGSDESSPREPHVRTHPRGMGMGLSSTEIGKHARYKTYMQNNQIAITAY